MLKSAWPDVKRRPASLAGNRRSALAENVFLNLASRSLGQCGNDREAGWNFEVRHLRARKFSQIRLGYYRAVLEYHKGVRSLTPFLVRHSDHRSFLNCGMG